MHGEGAETAPRDGSHLIVRAFHTALAEFGGEAPGLHLASTNRIPHGRGLGSSAAAICAGVLLARDLVAQQTARTTGEVADAGSGARVGQPDRRPPGQRRRLLARRADHRLDRHRHRQPTPTPTPAPTRTELRHHGPRPRARADPELRPVVFVPPSESSTEQARRLLPAQVPHADAAFNAARAALLIAGLTSRPEVLLTATEDRLHQPYRVPAMPASAELVSRLRTAGWAAVISGAGPRCSPSPRPIRARLQRRNGAGGVVDGRSSASTAAAPASVPTCRSDRSGIAAPDFMLYTARGGRLRSHQLFIFRGLFGRRPSGHRNRTPPDRDRHGRRRPRTPTMTTPLLVLSV